MQVGNSKAHNQTHPMDKMLYKLKEGNPLTRVEILEQEQQLSPVCRVKRK